MPPPAYSNPTSRWASVWLGPMPTVVVYSPPGIAEVLKSSKHSSKGVSYHLLHEWLGTGLLTAAGAKWKSRRRMITPSFHFEILRNYARTFAEQARILISLLDQQADTDRYIDLFPYITHAALDIICDTAMGTTVNAQRSPENEYVDAVYAVSRSLFNRYVGHRRLAWPGVHVLRTRTYMNML